MEKRTESLKKFIMEDFVDIDKKLNSYKYPVSFLAPTP
jgi:hypothetical protein